MRAYSSLAFVTPIEVARRVSRPASPANDDPAFWSQQMDAVSSRRDVDAFMRIFGHFAPRLQRYLTGLGVPPAHAEELVQEAMLRLWKRAALYDPARATLSTWLFRIARNLYIDSVRGEPHWLPIQDGLDLLDASGDMDACASAEWSADGASLAAAIDALPPQQARVIRMSYFEAKSHGQIAEELGQPLGSVKSNLRRAFAKLQAALGTRP